MIEALRSVSGVSGNSPTNGDDAAAPQIFDQQGEAAGLSIAIQRLITERDHYKNQAATQERDIIRLRALNDELRHQNKYVALVRDHYMRVSIELVTQLKHVDQVLKDVAKKTYGVAAEFGGDDAGLVALARRLSPNSGQPQQALS